MKDKKKIASEYTGLDEFLIEYLRKFNNKEKRMVSIVIMAIETFLEKEEIKNE